VAPGTLPAVRTRVLLLASCGVLVAAAPASGAQPLYGTVARSWASAARNAPPRTVFHVAATHIIANFVWKRVPTPGQKLLITWRRPDHTKAAVWTNRTIATDRPGTRLYAMLTHALFANTPGRWLAVLSVGGRPRGTVQIRIAP
jgi:hypothetical protein